MVVFADVFHEFHIAKFFSALAVKWKIKIYGKYRMSSKFVGFTLQLFQFTRKLNKIKNFYLWCMLRKCLFFKLRRLVKSLFTKQLIIYFKKKCKIVCFVILVLVFLQYDPRIQGVRFVSIFYILYNACVLLGFHQYIQRCLDCWHCY